MCSVTLVESDFLWPSSGKNTGVGYHALLQGGLPDPGVEHPSPASPALQVDSLSAEPLGRPQRANTDA